MANRSLIEDYLKRSKSRLKAIDTLFDDKAYADVVRESQEVIELLLKALLSKKNVSYPRIHDVSDLLDQITSNITDEELKVLKEGSRILRRDLELSFYGSDDLTPSEFYKKEDGDEARNFAVKVYEIVTREIAESK